MKRFNQAAVALTAFGLANIAFAGSYSEGCDCEITVPKYAGGVRVGVEALYMGADVKDTEYAFSFQSQSGVDTFRSHNVESEKDWGYSIELAYQAAGTGNDFVINWTDQEFTGSDTIALAGSSNGSIGTFIIGWAENLNGLVSGGSLNMEDDDDLSSAKGSYDVDYTKVDAEAGQMIKIGRDSVTLRFHAGLRYADLDTKFKAFFEDDIPVENGNFVAESDFDGLGPRMGIDGAWHVNNHFSLEAKVSAAVLVGDVSASQKYEDTDNPTPPVEYRLAHRTSYDHKVVPNLEARLGVACDHAFNNGSMLHMHAGWQVSNYYDVDYKLSDSGTDVGIYGWYFGASYTL